MLSTANSGSCWNGWRRYVTVSCPSSTWPIARMKSSGLFSAVRISFRDRHRDGAGDTSFHLNEPQFTVRLDFRFNVVTTLLAAHVPRFVADLFFGFHDHLHGQQFHLLSGFRRDRIGGGIAWLRRRRKQLLEKPYGNDK